MAVYTGDRTIGAVNQTVAAARAEVKMAEQTAVKSRENSQQTNRTKLKIKTMGTAQTDCPPFQGPLQSDFV